MPIAALTLGNVRQILRVQNLSSFQVTMGALKHPVRKVTHCLLP